MGGGLMQLVAYGAQDVYLTGNPQITFFKVVYRRHTNFSMESILQVWEGGTQGYPTTNTATIRRNGDLIYHMWIEMIGSDTCTFPSTPDSKRGVVNPGTKWIKYVELEIGGQRIDRLSGDWISTYHSLTQPNTSACSVTIREEHNTGQYPVANKHYINIQKEGTLFQHTSGTGGFHITSNVSGASIEYFQNNRFLVPLPFYFCKNPGLALPLISLQYHEVKIHLENTFTELFGGDPQGSEYKLWVDYIFLDTDERRRFSQLSHEYLIEQVQEQIVTDLERGAELSFNHPVKELVWISRDYLSGGQFYNATNSAHYFIEEGSRDLLGEFQLKFNGKDRFSPQDVTYFTRLQILNYHTGCGGVDLDGLDTNNKEHRPDNSIAVYSFALKPEEHQPSGTCNFSRLDHVELSCNPKPLSLLVKQRLIQTVQAYSSSNQPVNSDKLNGVSLGTQRAKVFAVNYNVLRIMNGMGGLAYAN